MNTVTLPGRPAALAGASVALTGAETPLGMAVARRLAAEAGALVLALDAGRAPGRAVLAEVRRIRALRRQPCDPAVVPADPTTEPGARAFVAGALDACGHLDAVVHLVEPCAGASGAPPPPDRAVLGRLLPLIREAAAALEREGGGRLLAIVDVSDCRGAATRGVIAAELEELVHAVAQAYAGSVAVNGVIVDAPRPAADRTLALAAGPPPAEVAPRAPLHAAAGVIGLLASPASGGLSGHVLHLGPSATLPQAPPELMALFARSALA